MALASGSLKATHLVLGAALCLDIWCSATLEHVLTTLRCSRIFLVFSALSLLMLVETLAPISSDAALFWRALVLLSRIVVTFVLLLAGFATAELSASHERHEQRSPPRRLNKKLRSEIRDLIANHRDVLLQHEWLKSDSAASSRCPSPTCPSDYQPQADALSSPTTATLPPPAQPLVAAVGQLPASPPLPANAVAITGVGMRFPGGLTTPAEFWDVLVNKRCVLEEQNASRWSLERYHDPGERVPGHFCAPRFGLVPTADMFDPAFFSISAADAEAMDPQQRMFLTCVIDALDRSGIPFDTLKGTDAGVWVGTSVMEYLAVQAGDPLIFNAHSNPGVALCVIANRVSFFLGTRGPSMAVDTACASGLTALELGWRAVSDGRCNLALVGGTNNLLLPEMTVSYSHMGVLARDGRCKSFDARADGYARGEGYGCVVLKPLQAALADGNPVLAVVRGCRSNANGDQTTGLTKPSLHGQADLIHATWAEAGLDPSLVDYVEAHGTGTAVGDPIEANAIGSALGRARLQRGLPPLPICSNKANLGHMEPAAALGSLIKACLMIQHRTLLPQALFVVPHPDIDWRGGNICVLTEPTPFTASRPLTVAVNAFGFGGSNSHAILQAYTGAEAEAGAGVGAVNLSVSDHEQDNNLRRHSSNSLNVDSTVDQTALCGWRFGANTSPSSNSSSSSTSTSASSSTTKPLLLVLSAASSESLKMLVARWEKFSSDGDSLVAAACAAQRRVHLPHRAAIIAASSSDFTAKAMKFTSNLDEASTVAVTGKAVTGEAKICFVFSGQGPQHKEMGRDLYATSAVFRTTVQQCDQAFQRHAGYSFLEHSGLFLPHTTARVDMDRPEAAQPAICFFQMGLYAQLVAWGLRPRVVLGHSVGEVAAAWAAGRLSLDDTVHLIFVRAREQQKTEGAGGMIAVASSRAKAEAIIAARGLALHIAAVNSPSSVTLGGAPTAIAEMRRVCKEVYQLQSAVLGVRCAYHTPQMQPIEASLLAGLAFLSSAIAPAAVGTSASSTTTTADQEEAAWPLLYSSVTGHQSAPGARLDGEYWWRNVREEVNFLAAMQAVMAECAPDMVLELSSKPALQSLIRQTVGASPVHVAGTSDRAYVSESQQLLAAVAQCYVKGAAVDWVRLYGLQAPTVPLPAYPFKEESYMKSSQVHKAITRRRVVDPFLTANMHLSIEQFPWLADHVVGGNAIVSATTFIELLLETVRRPAASGPAVLSRVSIERAAPMAPKDVLEMAAVPCSGGVWEVASSSQSSPSGRVVHCTAQLALDNDRGDADGDVASFNSASAVEGHTPLDFVGCTTLSALRRVLNSTGNNAHASVGASVGVSAGVSGNPSVGVNGSQLLSDSDSTSVTPRQFTPWDPKQVYKTFVDMGFRYGPAFALISELWVGDEEALYVVEIPSSHRYAGFRFHPAVLDACLHGSLMCAGSWSINYIPVGIHHLELDSVPTDCAFLVVHAAVVARGIESLSIDIDVCCAFSPDTNLPPRRAAVFRGLRARPMVLSDRAPRIAADTLLQMSWQPAVVEHALDGLAHVCSSLFTPSMQSQIKIWQESQADLQRLVAMFSAAALATPGAKASPRYEDSLARLAALLPQPSQSQPQSPAAAALLASTSQSRVTRPSAAAAVPSATDIAQLEASLRERLPFYSVELDITHALGTQLCDISASPSIVGDLIYKPELLPKFFRESFTVDATYQAIASMVEQLAAPLCAQGRVVRILEVGLRTGGLALHIARKLAKWGDAGLINYVASDLASTFFGDAESRLAAHPWVRLQRFNIESDAAAQGLAASAFDIVVVFSTLHGVVDVPTALTQLHGLLAPGGVLINYEPSEPSQWWFMEMWFGAMDVWWRMADFRSNRRYYEAHGRAYPTCWMTSAEWVAVFAECGGFEEVVDLARKPCQLLFNGLVARKHRLGLCAVDVGAQELVSTPTASPHKSNAGHSLSLSPAWPTSPSTASNMTNATPTFTPTSQARSPTTTVSPVSALAASPLWPRMLRGKPLLVLSSGSLDMSVIKALSAEFAAHLICRPLPTIKVDATVVAHVRALAGAATIVFDASCLTAQTTTLARAQEVCNAALAVAQTLAGPDRNGNGSVLLVVTSSACGPCPAGPLGGALQGLVRALSCEMDRLAVGLVDIDAAADAHSNTVVVADFLRGLYFGEGEVAFRSGQGVLVPRLARLALPDDYNHAVASAFAVEGDGKGSLSKVQVRWTPPAAEIFSSYGGPAMDGGDAVSVNSSTGHSVVRSHAEDSAHALVEIAVEAACLNFKDVLVTLNMLGDLQRPADDGDLGFGCVGTVVGVRGRAESISDMNNTIAVGVKVVALAGACLSSRVECDAALVCAVPAAVLTQPPSMLACITLYATAYDALVVKARAGPGDTVLVHSAASGLGQCAIQLALHLGCTVIVSCGSEAKRAVLRAQFALTMLTDSRRPTVFAADVRRWTQGKGVTVVLNCLAGKAQRVSLALCAAGARFVEVGKRDMLLAHTLSQAPLLHNISFLSCQLDLEAQDNPAAIKAILQSTLALMADRVFVPIQTEHVALTGIAGALQHASRGDSHSKPVFDLSPAQLLSLGRVPPARRQFGRHSTCLVTGGLGGLGLVVARMLAWRGAGHVLLVGRSAARLSRRQLNEIALIRSLGADVLVRACDTSDRLQVDALVAELVDEKGLQLDVVVHLAAVLSDGLAVSLDPAAFAAPIAAKGFGAVHLHEATRRCPLRAFVVATSTQDLVGMEQAAYVAANTLAQQLVLHRHALGLPATAVALGPVLGAGMVERDRTVARVLSSRGAGFLTAIEAASALAEAAAFSAFLPPFFMTSRIDGVISNVDAPLARGNAKWLHLLRPTAAAALGSAEDAALLARQSIADIFCLPLEDVDAATPLLSFGVDSLVATELLSFFRSRLRLDVSYTDILSGLSIAALIARARPA